MNQENLQKFRTAQTKYDNQEHPHYFEDDPRTRCECCGDYIYDEDVIIVMSDEPDVEDRSEMKVCEECESSFTEIA